ncbi:hypothetical protein IFHNHDMJ_00557 [Synechococcus sp. CBW1107]|nr:hypothetical protein IFHNHDMJ_00557 [Synechococcus sp. CBW1107]
MDFQSTDNQSEQNETDTLTIAKSYLASQQRNLTINLDHADVVDPNIIRHDDTHAVSANVADPTPQSEHSSAAPSFTLTGPDSMGGAPAGTLLYHSRIYVGLGRYTNRWVHSSGLLTMEAGQTTFDAAHHNWNAQGQSNGVNYYVPSEIQGNSLDNLIHGHGALIVNGNELYAHGDRIDGGAGNDTIYGWAGNDWLIGGSGDDVLNGGRYHDRLDGGAGNDLLIGETGSDTLDGGDGNDRLLSGVGSDTLIGGTGDDWLIVDAMQGGEQNHLSGGSGFDTFVLSPLVAPELQFEAGADSTSFSQTVSTAGLGRLSVMALAKGFFPLSSALYVGQGLLSHLASGGSTPPSVALNWSKAQIITDFNPYEDSLILNLHPDNDKPQLVAKQFTGTGGGFYVMQEINGAPAYLADVTFDMAAMQKHASRNGHGHLSTRDLAELAFNTLQRTYVLADGSSSQLALQEGEQTVGLEGLDALGNNAMLILGAHGATTVTKGINGVASFSGTALDDILEGHHTPTANHPDLSRAVLYGLDGDDILMGGGGSNLLYGGAGSDTAFYGYATNNASQGISVDMAATVDGAVLLHNGIRELGKPVVTEGADLDYLYAIENIVGSDRDDIIRGDHADNLLVSGKGNDTLAGRGGRDTFLLNGGTNTIEDFTPGEDRIQIAIDAYAGVSSSADLQFNQSETDGLGRITTVSGETISILEGFDASSFDVARDVEFVDADGQAHAVTGSVELISGEEFSEPESDVITGEPIQPLLPGAIQPLHPDDDITHGLSDPGNGSQVDQVTGILVNSTDTSVLAQNGVAERFVIPYAWGRSLTIDGFNPSEDMLDLTMFSNESILPGFMDQPGGTLVDLGFNAQTITLNGIIAADLTQGAVLLG